MNWCISLASFLLLFKKKILVIFFLNGGIGFCHTTMWIQHNYPYIPSLLRLPHITTSYPSRPSQSTSLGSLYYAATSHKLTILHMTVYICQCSFSIQRRQWQLPSFTGSYKFILYICVFIPSLQIGSPIPLF